MLMMCFGACFPPRELGRGFTAPGLRLMQLSTPRRLSAHVEAGVVPGSRERPRSRGTCGGASPGGRQVRRRPVRVCRGGFRPFRSGRRRVLGGRWRPHRLHGGALRSKPGSRSFGRGSGRGGRSLSRGSHFGPVVSFPVLRPGRFVPMETRRKARGRFRFHPRVQPGVHSERRAFRVRP
jgi:hypothetical protein